MPMENPRTPTPCASAACALPACGRELAGRGAGVPAGGAAGVGHAPGAARRAQRGGGLPVPHLPGELRWPLLHRGSGVHAPAIPRPSAPTHVASCAVGHGPLVGGSCARRGGSCGAPGDRAAALLRRSRLQVKLWRHTGLTPVQPNSDAMLDQVFESIRQASDARIGCPAA
jgi:hypothetical protein